MPSPDTSHSLLEQLADPGDDAAWERFARIYQPLIRAWVARSLRDPATIDDVVQETLTTLFQGLHGFRHNARPGAFRAWLKAVAINHIRRQLRKAMASLPGDPAEIPDLDGRLGRACDEEHDRYVLGKLLELIRPEFEPATWDAFRRVVFEGEKPRAAAEALAMTTNAVYIAKARVLKRLREVGRGLIDEF